MDTLEQAVGSVVPIDAETALDPTAGNKALGLQLLLRRGLAVPRSWVVLPGVEIDELERFGRALAELEAGGDPAPGWVGRRRVGTTARDVSAETWASVAQGRVPWRIEELRLRTPSA